MSHIDVKATTWLRFKITDETKVDEIKTWLETGKNPFELFNYFGDYLEDEGSMADSEEYMHPSENDGQHTVELYNDNCVIIWNNVDKDIE